MVIFHLDDIFGGGGGQNQGRRPGQTDYSRQHLTRNVQWDKIGLDSDKVTGPGDFSDQLGGLLDESGGYYDRLPTGDTAPDAQYRQNQWWQQRRDDLLAQGGRDAASHLTSGLNSTQAYREGGLAALLSPYYQGLAGNAQATAQGRAANAQTPSSMYHRDQQNMQAAADAAADAGRTQGLMGLAGAAIGAGAGLIGGPAGAAAGGAAGQALGQAAAGGASEAVQASTAAGGAWPGPGAAGQPNDPLGVQGGGGFSVAPSGSFGPDPRRQALAAAGAAAPMGGQAIGMGPGGNPMGHPMNDPVIASAVDNAARDVTDKNGNPRALNDIWLYDTMRANWMSADGGGVPQVSRAPQQTLAGFDLERSMAGMGEAQASYDDMTRWAAGDANTRAGFGEQPTEGRQEPPRWWPRNPGFMDRNMAAYMDRTDPLPTGPSRMDGLNVQERERAPYTSWRDYEAFVPGIGRRVDAPTLSDDAYVRAIANGSGRGLDLAEIEADREARHNIKKFAESLPDSDSFSWADYWRNQ